jgi:hypothetical protein
MHYLLPESLRGALIDNLHIFRSQVESPQNRDMTFAPGSRQCMDGTPEQPYRNAEFLGTDFSVITCWATFL